MRNLKEVAQESYRKGWTPLYYDIKHDAVFTEDGEDRFYVTELIRPNTSDEIEAVVRRWLSL